MLRMHRWRKTVDDLQIPRKSICNLASICLMNPLTNSFETSTWRFLPKFTTGCPPSASALPRPYINMNSNSSHRIHFLPFVGVGGWKIYFRALMMLPPSSINIVSHLRKFLAQSYSLPLSHFPSLLRFVYLALFYLYICLIFVSCNLFKVSVIW